MDIQVPILENRGYKTHMLGNIKLVGGLLARGMLAAKARFFFFFKKSTSTYSTYGIFMYMNG